MPVALSGVMLVLYSAPIGVAIDRPPANCLPFGAVWQAIQSPAVAMYLPCSISCALGAARLTVPGPMSLVVVAWLAYRYAPPTPITPRPKAVNNNFFTVFMRTP